LTDKGVTAARGVRDHRGIGVNNAYLVAHAVEPLGMTMNTSLGDPGITEIRGDSN
jgi:hypothetical protein